jgi:hypothetical protein
MFPYATYSGEFYILLVFIGLDSSVELAAREVFKKIF